MVQVSLNSTNRRESSFTQFPKLKLKVDEKKRIALLDQPIEMAYTHALRAPRIVNGEPVMEKKVNKDGTKSWEDYARDFVGQPLCLGDLGILEDRGLDTKNCPACAQSQKGDQIDGPKARYAVNVLIYNTRPGTFEVTSPFSVQVAVWAFTENRFNELIDLAAEHDESLKAQDLLLGPCVAPENFQKYAIHTGDAQWMKDEDRARLAIETMRENRYDDLESAIGFKASRAKMEDDIETILQRWRTVNAFKNGDATILLEKPSLTEGLEGLLSEVQSPTVKASTPVAASSDTDDTPTDVPDFDAILQGLDLGSS